MTVTSKPVLPNLTGVIDRHRLIPKARRQEKLYLTLFGVALGLLTYLGQTRWHWAPAAWITGYFFAGNYVAGDYRRAVVDGAIAAVKDVVPLAQAVGDAGQAAWRAVRSVGGRGE